MSEGKKKLLSLAELRALAESAIIRVGARHIANHQLNLDRLLYELDVHQVELELQNKELLTAHAELEQSRDRYLELYDFAPVGYLTLDRGGKIREINLSAARLLFADRTRLIGRPLAAFLSQSDADVLHIHLQEVQRSRAKHSCQVSLEAGGRHTPLRIDSIAFSGDARQSPGFRCVVIDLSELVSAEHGLLAAEARKRTVLDTVADAVISSDSAGLIESFNKASERLFGRSETEVLGQSVGILMREQDAEEDARTAESQFGSGAVASIDQTGREAVGLRKDGTRFPLELWIGKWWERGEPKNTFVMRDITARKRREDELRASEGRFRQIAEHIEDVFWVHDRAGRTSYVSPAFEAIWGRPGGEALGAHSVLLSWAHPEDHDRVSSSYESLFKGVPFDEVYRIQRPEGSDRWIRARAFVIREQDGSTSGDIGVAEDITERHELEDQLRQSQKLEAVGSLASSIAHDFNNVLQAVLGCVRLASENVPDQQARQYLDRAADAARRGSDLSAQLMAFARNRRVQPRPIAIDACVRHAATLIERLVSEQISVEIETRAGDCAILADPVQVEQILMNLAANARDAMPRGGKLTIVTDVIEADQVEAKRLGLVEAEHYFRLVFEDSGVGMDEGTRARLFEPFFTTKESGKGTGLGLSTVLSVTRQLGGSVEVDSRPDEGSSFTFHFPRSEQPPEQPVQHERAAVRLSGTTLLVEDEPLIRMTVRHYLEQLGLTVLEAESPDEARQICENRDQPVDLLVSDLVLPGMSGSRLATLLKQRYPALRVLFMSANAEFLPEEELEGSRFPVLRKPFDREELAVELQAVLEG